MQVCKLCSRLAVSSLWPIDWLPDISGTGQGCGSSATPTTLLAACSRRLSPAAQSCQSSPASLHLAVGEPTSPKFYACHCLSALAATDRPRLLFPIPCSAPVKIFMLPPISPTSTPHADAAPNRPPPTDSLTHGLVELNVRSLRYAHATTPKAMTRK